MIQKFPQTHSSHKLMKTNSKTMEGMEALRQLATGSLLIQGGVAPEAKRATVVQQSSSSSSSLARNQVFTSSSSSRANRVVPIIKEPESLLDGEQMFHFLIRSN